MKKTKLQVGRRITPKNINQGFREKMREKLKTDPRFLKNAEPGHPPTNAKGENQYTKAHGAKLISEASKIYLQDKAPEKYCRAVGLAVGATWADVIAIKQLLLAAEGQMCSLDFMHDVTEGSLPSKHEFSGIGGLALPPPCTFSIKTKETK